MKVLHIFRTVPDNATRQLADGVSVGNEIRRIDLYKPGLDYAQIVKEIVDSDRIICWW